MIRILSSGKYRLYTKKKVEETTKRKGLAILNTPALAKRKAQRGPAAKNSN